MGSRFTIAVLISSLLISFDASFAKPNSEERKEIAKKCRKKYPPSRREKTRHFFSCVKAGGPDKYDDKETNRRTSGEVYKECAEKHTTRNIDAMKQVQQCVQDGGVGQSN